MSMSRRQWFGQVLAKPMDELGEILSSADLKGFFGGAADRGPADPEEAGLALANRRPDAGTAGLPSALTNDKQEENDQ